MLVSTKGRYALRVLVDMAEHQSESYVPLREIAQRQEISTKYLESIVKILVKGGVITGLRGKGGGYRLCKPPEMFTVGGILRLTEGSLAPVVCMDPHASICPRSGQCRTYQLWRGLDQVVSEYLDRFSLADLMFSGQSLI